MVPRRPPAAWRTLYSPLPAALQLPVDYTTTIAAAAVAAGASASTGAHIANAASAVSAAAGSFIPSLIASLIPVVGQFETNWNSKLKEKNVMMENSVKGKERSVRTMDPSARPSSCSAGLLLVCSAHSMIFLLLLPCPVVVSLSLNIGDASSKADRKRRKKRGIQMMSSNQRKQAGLTRIPKQELKYDMFRPMHQLWVAYMHDILDPQNSRCVRPRSRRGIVCSVRASRREREREQTRPIDLTSCALLVCLV